MLTGDACHLTPAPGSISIAADPDQPPGSLPGWREMARRDARRGVGSSARHGPYVGPRATPGHSSETRENLSRDEVAPPSGPRDANRDGSRFEVEERVRFESLIIDLAAGFVSIDPERVDQAIEECLRRIVRALGLDRSTPFQRSGEDLVATHSRAVPGRDAFPKVWARADLLWSFMRVMHGEPVIFSRLDDPPEEAAADKALIRRFGPKANVTMPLVADREVLGALAFGSMGTERTWAPAVDCPRRPSAMVTNSVPVPPLPMPPPS